MPTANDFLSSPDPTAIRVANVNGVALHDVADGLPPDELRQRACTELLRQRAQGLGLLANDDRPGLDGAISEAATRAIEALLERELDVPEPSDEACRRYFDGQPRLHTVGERARVRHILFAVTPGIDAMQLSKKAEEVLLEVRCARDDGARFAELAGKFSNCPSGQNGGELGWLAEPDCAAEFAREIFGKQDIGVLSRLVRTRFGLHIVEVCARDPGRSVTYEQARASVAAQLRNQSWANALRQYLQLLAGAADLEGVDLDAATSPLVQ